MFPDRYVAASSPVRPKQARCRICADSESSHVHDMQKLFPPSSHTTLFLYLLCRGHPTLYIYTMSSANGSKALTIKNVQINWKEKIRQTNFSPRTFWDTPTLRPTFLTAHFGIHRCCAATALKLRHCNKISPTLCCLLTRGMASKSTKATKTWYSRDGVLWGMANDTCRQCSLSLRFDWYQFWPPSVFIRQYL